MPRRGPSREQMELHRTNPHLRSLPQADGSDRVRVGEFRHRRRVEDDRRWRCAPRYLRRARNGTRVDGVSQLRQALLDRPTVFVQTLVEKLMIYALGRGLTYEDMPAGARDRAQRSEPESSVFVVGFGNRVERPVSNARCSTGKGLPRSRRGSVGSGRKLRTCDHQEDLDSAPDVSAWRRRHDGFALPRGDGAGRLCKRQRGGGSAVTNGVHLRAAWRRHAVVDAAGGRSASCFELSQTLQPLKPFEDSLVVVSNLKRAGTVVEMHAAAASGWLSGAIPKRTEGEDYRVGVTIDQILVKQVGQSSPFPSLEFATEDFTGYVGVTPGFSRAYMNTISWASATSPLPMEINPRTAFERLFGDSGSEIQRQRRQAEDRSILDAIVRRRAACSAAWGPRPRQGRRLPR